ncbi:peptidoglycan/xylan/chitin deacetylase (PgdA/CDA1 family) [Aquabacter spiritensis]|uniref:Chitooligosaccharide deacetylase n=2 Tax=Aquabacter spiritensis TaxID=933073 RepID=A0A4R3LPV3_9HYPH|nr:polysaccharide deacetylase family protein [Aquabacter spiritensis]TCT02432.1 peptidoglycan/xylan/chitin deacetylase (PgdA/CDA1 family) [Aquabacter spiritensis]
MILFARALAALRAPASVTILALLGLVPPADAAPCPGQSDALGTARVMEVPPGARVGTKSFPQTLPLADREVVLTFDDGPWPTTTAAILDALKAECVRATFFLIGENARIRPELVRRARAEGHTIAHHSMTHPEATLAGLPFPAAVAEIERGIAADDFAAYGTVAGAPRIPFFRFPGFAATPALLDYLSQRGISVFGADLWASDWNKMTPEQELDLVLRRLDAAGRGIILFHDTKSQTAAMIPAFLRALAERGYHTVHIVPASATARPPN